MASRPKVDKQTEAAEGRNGVNGGQLMMHRRRQVYRETESTVESGYQIREKESIGEKEG